MGDSQLPVKRVAVIGAMGQLGTDLVKTLQEAKGIEVLPLGRQQLDVTDVLAVEKVIREFRPKAVINCAAYVLVDDSEDVGASSALEVNTLGARNVSIACLSVNADCVYISTDYVFNGQQYRPYDEEDPTCPLSLYGVSKASGEQLVRATLEQHYVVRCSGLFGAAGVSGKGGNFINTMIRLAMEGREINVVDDQRFSPTYTKDIAKKIAWLLDTKAYGTWHITCQGDCTWYELANEVFDILGLHPKLTPTTTEMFGAKAKRPSYSVLGHGRLKELNVNDLPFWQDSVAQYLCAKEELLGR